MNAHQFILYILFPVGAYLLGSVPFAWLIGKAHGVDIRTVGSKNIGATNLGRTLGKKFFWYAFLLDAAKGFFPVLLATLFLAWWNAGRIDDFVETHYQGTAIPAAIVHGLPSWLPLLTAVAAVLGHTFPLWLKFKGGKGVATSFGVVLGFWPLYTIAGVAAGMIFVAMLLVYRYISLASMTGVTCFAILVMLLGTGYFDGGPVRLGMPWHDLKPLVIVAWLFAGLIIFRHRGNIRRLVRGTEPQVGKREIDRSKLRP